MAYAAPGNLLGSLHDQLQDYLNLAAAGVAEINWRRLQFPAARESLRHDLEEELKLQLQADSNEPVQLLLRRHAPNVAGTGKRGVLWLNWGLFGHDTDCQTPLTRAQLSDWLRFSSEFIGTHCPDDLRIVSYLAIELEPPKHPPRTCCTVLTPWPTSMRPAIPPSAASRCPAPNLSNRAPCGKLTMSRDLRWC